MVSERVGGKYGFVVANNVRISAPRYSGTRLPFLACTRVPPSLSGGPSIADHLDAYFTFIYDVITVYQYSRLFPDVIGLPESVLGRATLRMSPAWHVIRNPVSLASLAEALRACNGAARPSARRRRLGRGRKGRATARASVRPRSAPLAQGEEGGGRVGGEARRQSGTCWTLSLRAPPTGLVTKARASDTRMMKGPRARCGRRGPERDRAAGLPNGGRPLYPPSAGPEYVNGVIRNAIICGREDDSGVSLFLHVCQGLFLFSSHCTRHC